jgi:hypothetical protein
MLEAQTVAVARTIWVRCARALMRPVEQAVDVGHGGSCSVVWTEKRKEGGKRSERMEKRRPKNFQHFLASVPIRRMLECE